MYLNAHKHSDGDGNNIRTEELAHIQELLAAGHLKPVIDRCYSMEQIVEAHRYVDTGHKRGNVIITVG